MNRNDMQLETSDRRTAKQGLPLALLAFCFALTTNALAAEPPVIFGGDSDFPPDAPACVGVEDIDHDGICNVADNCARAFNPSQGDGDLDGRGDVCDNCPIVSNGLQQDADRDGIGNACDPGDPSLPSPTGPGYGSDGPRDFGRN